MNSDAPEATHMVTAPAVQLLMDRSEEAAIATCLLCGTALVVQEINGEWAYVEPAGGLLAGGWMPSTELRPLESMKVARPAEQIIADARQLVGVYYLWGGATPFGMDCSALAQLMHRLNGFEIPRDAYMQFAKGKPVDPPYQPGDLLFFHSDADKQRITHVGISLGGWDMIHSSRAKNGVYEENVEKAPRLRDTFAGARAFIR
jgi:cell wall-associated NlpC family hydrolase